MTSSVYWLQRGGQTQVRLFGPPESTVNWPGRRREEGGSEHIAQIRVIQVLPVADSWIDEDGFQGLDDLGSEHDLLKVAPLLIADQPPTQLHSI